MIREDFPDGDERLNYMEVEASLGPPQQYGEIQTHARGREDMFRDGVHVRRGNQSSRRPVHTIDRQDLFGEWPWWARPIISVYTELPTEDNDLQPGNG